MKHHSNIRTLGRKRDQRVALIRSLAENLILRGRILTTEARAKEVRPFVEKLITRGKAGTVAARRDILSRLGGRERVMKKVVDELAPRFKERAGGYTRITKVHQKRTDGASSAVIEFI
ncbi:MAG: 50S ribosomal protein L17 [Candidatus Paceibacteria bacterium]